MTVPLRLLELVLERISAETERKQPPGKVMRTLLHTLQCLIERESDPKQVEEMKAEKEVLQHLDESDICVLPSVLLMNNRRTAPEWSVFAC